MYCLFLSVFATGDLQDFQDPPQSGKPSAGGHSETLLTESRADFNWRPVASRCRKIIPIIRGVRNRNTFLNVNFSQRVHRFYRRAASVSSGARTNFKVWGGGGTRPAPSAVTFLVVPLHFLALKVQLVVLVSAFVMVSTVWSVSCLLFFYSCFPCPTICKGGGTCPRVL